MKSHNASDLLEMRIEEMSTQNQVYEDFENGMKTAMKVISKKKYTGNRRTIDLLIALSMFARKHDIHILVSESDNLGVITEAIVKSYLKGMPLGKGGNNETDLIQGGRRFDIKLVVKGSSSFASSINLDTDDDVLIISNLGVKIIRKAMLKAAYANGYMKKSEFKLSPTILTSEYVIETEFTKRLDLEMGVNVWD